MRSSAHSTSTVRYTRVCCTVVMDATAASPSVTSRGKSGSTQRQRCPELPLCDRGPSMATYWEMPPSPDRTVDAADDEGRLIDKSRQGDAAAFTLLVSAHQGRVRAYIGGTVNRPEV